MFQCAQILIDIHNHQYNVIANGTATKKKIALVPGLVDGSIFATFETVQAQ